METDPPSYLMFRQNFSGELFLEGDSPKFDFRSVVDSAAQVSNCVFYINSYINLGWTFFTTRLPRS